MFSAWAVRHAARCFSNDSQRSTSVPNFAAISSTAWSSPIPPLSQRPAASAKMVRPTAKTSDALGRLGGGETVLQGLDRRLEAEQHDAAAERIARGDDGVDRLPGRDRRLRLELPPIGLEPGVIKLGERACDRVVLERARLGGDDLDQELASDLAGGLEGRDQLGGLRGLERRVVVRMIKAQHLDAVIHRPFDQPAADILAELELQRTRTGQFDRPRHPQVLSGAGGEQRIAAIFVVEQHPEAGASGGDASRLPGPPAP